MLYIKLHHNNRTGFLLTEYTSCDKYTHRKGIAVTMATTIIVRGLVFLITLFHVLPCCLSGCSEPMPGKCFSNENASRTATTVSVAAANCSFSTDQGLCQYTQTCKDHNATNWNVTNAGTARAQQSRPGTCGRAYSVMESPWLQIHHLSCLRFTYSKVSPADLDVFVEYQNGSVHTVFNDSENIQPGIGKVILRLNGGGGASLPDVANVEISEISLDPGSCTFPASRPGTSSYMVNATTGWSGVNIMRLGKNGVSTSPTTSNRKTDDKGKLSAIIGASVGAVVFVIIVVAVVVVIVYRRRHAKRSPNGNTTAAATVENRADGDMINLTSSTSPYELAEDGAPGKTRTAPRHANNHILTTRPTAPVLDDVDDGDYRRVSDAHSSVQTDVSAMYSQVQKKGKKAAGQPAGPGDAVYSQVNKKGKGITKAENQPDPDTVYSQVNKKGNNSAGHYDVPPAVNKKPGKPVIAPKPKQGKQPTSPTKNQVPGDTTGVDPYDTIDTVPSPGRPQPVSTEGAVETDDYNALDFDAVRRVKTETDEEEEAAGSYNFLYNDPSEGYSTAGEARKKVVIGSDYDHVQM